MIVQGKGRWALALLLLSACAATVERGAPAAGAGGAAAANGSALLDRALAARGGALASLAREVDARAYAGVPGDWRWEMVSCPPDALRWTLRTYGEDQTYTYDGTRALVSLGSASLPADAQTAAGLRSLARWLAVTDLSALRDSSRASGRELPSASLPSGIARGLRVDLADDGSSFDLLFDAQDRLAIVEGPLDLPGVGRGRVQARYSEHGSASGYVLPHRIVYSLAGNLFLEERVLRYTPNASCSLR